ncbi:MULTISPECIES: MBL fold metallo-hydrolase [Streptomyces]|uniref:MBL fold metallo-hydrolase n=1 Tax=Streptomyces caniscabiei TaxID=2746961 RepID=A0ABU4MUE2_9ACTN|nr:MULTISPECIES: MBL fold metallo-hydrolase [Streptomyces]MBE4734618.1 MBL fold metallo-hydrolase [Streptomyces caniscabiei]MBE4755489.1 MBL fold metallo-hydrolase [Streptomyces caniscabiei]MBE4772387.1 MBL fold metallo-hydrolase [Streptomyces caniscabiei]MBE4783227.1 MBL fold metallo-hydrolase [Streptomyces caniscabiei]MBE4792531.1 MBL fold metallo-hydrolase [Streptomyces caniscabiei]
MKVHHLNCGTMLPLTGALVCHVLLVEAPGGLVLVDSGFGLRDIAEPGRRLGSSRHLVRPVLRAEETAARQVEALGFRRDDVRHIVVTHFDFDHIGGLADFPDAQVHTTAAEALGAVVSPSRRERSRYRSAQWDHGPKLVEHTPDGEAWRGFAAAKELDAVAPGIVLVSLPGHTRGHACVAVDTGNGWILHAGDAFYHRGTLDGRSPAPRALRAVENLLAHDLKQVRANHVRLAALHRRAEADLTVVNAHDPVLLERMRTAP